MFESIQHTKKNSIIKAAIHFNKKWQQMLCFFFGQQQTNLV